MAATDFMVIDFSADGSASALHRDQLDLGFLGAQKIERASDIRFDETNQCWDIWLHRGSGQYWLSHEARGFASYDAGRKVEVEWLEQCRLQSVDPIQPDGILLLLEARTKLGL